MYNPQTLLKRMSLLFLIFSLITLGTEVQAQTSTVTIDANIDTDEYTFHLSLNEGKFLLYWEVVDDQIYFAMTAETTGYIGINVDPGIILTDADLYYGFVNATGAFMVDTYSNSIRGPTRSDVGDGGTDDILDFSGKEENGQTTFEFTRLLITGDSSHDNIIKLEKTLISWTTGPSDNIGDRPADSGRVEINFLTGNSKEVKDYTLYYIGGGILVGIVLIVFFARYLLKRRSPESTDTYPEID